MLTENQKELLRITKEKELLKQREERLNYYGILDEYQLHPKNLIVYQISRKTYWLPM